MSVLLLGGITLTSLTGCKNNNGSIGVQQLLQEQVWSLQNQLADRDRQIRLLKEELSQYKSAEDEITNNSNEEDVPNSLQDENTVKENETTMEASQNESQNITKNEDAVQQISIVDDYTISSRKLIALVGSNRTLFVHYKDRSGDRVQDVFTGEYYFVNVDSLINSHSKVKIYGEYYTPTNIGQLIPSLNSTAITDIPASWLKETGLKSMKESPTIEENKKDQTIYLWNICTLFDGEKTLFVTFSATDEKRFHDVFTGELYLFDNGEKTITELYNSTNEYDISIYGKKYRLIPMSFYPDIIANVKDGNGYISENVLKQLFEKLNGLNQKAVCDTGNLKTGDYVDMVLKNEHRTLYTRFSMNSIGDCTCLIDSFDGTYYYFTEAKNMASNVRDIWNGHIVLINGEIYNAEPLALQPLIVSYMNNKEINFNILRESSLLANGMSKEEIEDVKKLILK